MGGALPGSNHSSGDNLAGLASVPLPDSSSSPVRDSGVGGQLASRLGRLPALSMPPLIGSTSPDLGGEADSPPSAGEPQDHEDPSMLELYTAAMQRPSTDRQHRHR